jgi:hypothetical protein
LEQQNKKQLLIARQEQDSMSGPHQQGQDQFPPAVSPFGTQAGLSPNPVDTKSGKSKLGRRGRPGSPMPDSGMQQQRDLSAPKSTLPDLEFFPFGALPLSQQLPLKMKPPPISHPIANFNGQQPTPQQVEAMRNAQMNVQRRGVPPKPRMPQQMIQDQMLAHPAPARRQKYDSSRGPSIQELLEQNHAPPRQAQMEAEAQKRRDMEANRQQTEARESQQKFLQQQAARQQMQKAAMQKAAMHIEQQGIPQGRNPTIYQQYLAQRYFDQMQQAQQEQAGQQPRQQPQNVTAMSPQSSQSGMSNQQGAGLANMSVQQLRQQYQQRKAQLLQTFGQNVPQQHVQQMHQLELHIKTREQQAGQKPGQQPQNITAMSPQGSQSGMSNEQSAGLLDTIFSHRKTAPKKKSTKSKKVHLHAPPSSPPALTPPPEARRKQRQQRQRDETTR